MNRFFTLLLAASCFTAVGQSDCPNPYDGNGDGAVTTNDLLGLLGYFGDVDTDGDGIWDSEDECVFCVIECGDPVSYQGYDYATVLIGDQCWFAENLRNENYLNGDAIPSNLTDSEWEVTNSGALVVYGEGCITCSHGSPDGNACEEAWSLNEYGRLYNWYAVDDARGLCPSGWHVPTDGEWTVMTDFLGGESMAGSQMKTTYGWSLGGNGTNSSGFSGLPSGGLFGNANFDYAGYNGYWWSSYPGGIVAWYRSLNHSSASVVRNSSFSQNGFSVRCIQD